MKNWAEISQTALGLVLTEKEDIWQYDYNDFIPPYDKAAKALQNGGDAEAVIGEIGTAAYSTILEAGKSAKGIKIDWPSRLHSAASLYRNGQALHRIGAEMMKGEEPDLATVAEYLTPEVNGRYSFTSAAEIIPDVEPLEPIGWEPIDTHVGGLPKSGLTTIAADTGSGKTFLILRIAEAYARQGKRFLLFSFELSKEIIRGRLEMMNLPKKVLKNILISDEILSPSEVRIVAKRAREVKAAAVGVDYNELFVYSENSHTTSESTASAGYVMGHRIAREEGIPVIYLAQFRRTYGQALPTIQDLRNSGMGEKASRLVLLGHNPSQVMVGRPESTTLPYVPGTAYLIVGKSTFGYVHGGTGAIQIPWNGEINDQKPGWGDHSLMWVPLTAV